MPNTTRYAKSVNGKVHVIHPIQGEHTLCGDAFDISSEPDEADCAWVDYPHGPVTCTKCTEVVMACRGVRLKPTR
jgi:hypothetical protein